MIVEVDAGNQAETIEKELAWEKAKSALIASLDASGLPSTEASHHAQDWPLVDFLMPAFNAASTIRSTLESIFAQDYRRFRLIVVDDGSSDATIEIVREFADRLQPILLVRAKHGGIVDALNAGLAYVSAPITARFDADDVSFPNRISEQVSFLLEHPNCVAVSSSFYEMDEDGFLGREYRADGLELRSNILEYPAFEPKLPHSLMALRTPVLKALKYRYVHNAEDADLWWRLQRHGKLVVMKEIHGCYRIHDSSVSGKSVVEGRIQAVYSQLAALSARRILAGRPDLTFHKLDLERARSARCLREILDLFRESLTAKEWLYLQSASSMKLFELTQWRAYRIELSDIAIFFQSTADGKAARSGHRQKVRAALHEGVRQFYKSAPLTQKIELIRRHPRQLLTAFLKRR